MEAWSWSVEGHGREPGYGYDANLVDQEISMACCLVLRVSNSDQTGHCHIYAFERVQTS